MVTTPRIEAIEKDGVWLIKFKERLLYDDRTVREVADQISGSFPADGTAIRAVIDFGGVDLISSALLGKLILLQRRIDGTGGRLRLCEMAPTVSSVFRTSNLDRLFTIDRDRLASMESVS